MFHPPLTANVPWCIEEIFTTLLIYSIFKVSPQIYSRRVALVVVLDFLLQLIELNMLKHCWCFFLANVKGIRLSSPLNSWSPHNTLVESSRTIKIFRLGGLSFLCGLSADRWTAISIIRTIPLTQTLLLSSEILHERTKYANCSTITNAI